MKKGDWICLLVVVIITILILPVIFNLADRDWSWDRGNHRANTSQVAKQEELAYIRDAVQSSFLQGVLWERKKNGTGNSTFGH